MDFPFHNPIISTDVTGDLYTTPHDALIIINQLNEYGSHELDPNSADDGDISFIDLDSELSNWHIGCF